MIQTAHLSASWLIGQTDRGSYRRGMDYFRAGRATLQCAERFGNEGILLHGSCQGSARYPYDVQAEISKYHGRMTLEGDCDCPVGFNCKHVVAIVQSWLAGQLRQHAGADALDTWLRQRPGEMTQQPAPKKALLYLFTPCPQRGQQVQIGICISQRKKDGDWGKGRMTSASSLQYAWERPQHLQPIDEAILDLLNAADATAWSREYLPSGELGHLAVQKMLASGRAYWGAQRAGPLQPGESRQLQLAWERTAHGYQLQTSVAGGGLLMATSPASYLDPETLEIGGLQLPDGLHEDSLDWLAKAPPVTHHKAAEFSRRLILQAPELPTPIEVDIQPITAAPNGHLHITLDLAQAHTARAQLSYRYAQLNVDAGSKQHEIITEHDGRLLRLQRDIAAESELRQALQASGLTPTREQPAVFALNVPASGGELRDAWLEWLQLQLPELRATGWEVVLDGDNNIGFRNADSIDAVLEEGESTWFSMRFDLDCAGKKIPLMPLVTKLFEHYDPNNLPQALYLHSGDGDYVRIPSAQVEPVLRTLMGLFDQVKGDRITLARADATRLLDLQDVPVHGATSLVKLAHKLSNFSGLKQVKLPTTFKGELRHYQQQGLDWLQFLREHEFNGILADDMGLGKTVQALAHLAVEKRAGRMQKPCLIIAPTSLMGNWQREAATFTPKLSVLVLHGQDRHQHFTDLDQHDLVLSTYPLLPRDREVLLQQAWHVVILDEAQQIKNPCSQAAQVVRALSCNHRLCLTGTPMENHLGELWAQFDFLMPGFLGGQQDFTKRYRTPIEQHADQQRLQQLQRRTAPFLLRRSKQLVAKELPAKTEILRQASFDPKQARLYESVRLSMEKKVRQAIAAKGLAQSHIVVLDALLKLRQICCDPRLLPATTSQVRGVPSAKFNLLFELLPELLEEGRRVLLFSQFTSMLGLIEQELKGRKLGYTKLTGQTRLRDQAIQRFRSGEVNLILISLKAGGVGLNLIEADTVIHYDPWWNPAAEHQATDRAHRIGQDKPVFIYKLICAGTLEEKILTLQQHKQQLAASIYRQRRDANQPAIDAETIQALLAAD
ncbi:MAG: DEAD/DEAH box helicase [Wenzhouxiangellaceae bacterium]